jgi:hypothetical protein
MEPRPVRNVTDSSLQPRQREGETEPSAAVEPHQPEGSRNGDRRSADPNEVTIRRQDDGQIVAIGGDEHTAFLLGTTGFAPTPGGARDHYTLPAGEHRYEENEIARVGAAGARKGRSP